MSSIPQITALTATLFEAELSGQAENLPQVTASVIDQADVTHTSALCVEVSPGCYRATMIAPVQPSDVVAARSYRVDFTKTSPFAVLGTLTMLVTDTPDLPWIPSIQSVAARIRSATAGIKKPGFTLGAATGMFGDGTNPTRAEVDQLLRDGASTVSLLAGTLKMEDAEPLWPAARMLTTLWTARAVLLTRAQELVNSDVQDVVTHLWEEWVHASALFKGAANDVAADGGLDGRRFQGSHTFMPMELNRGPDYDGPTIPFARSLYWDALQAWAAQNWAE